MNFIRRAKTRYILHRYAIQHDLWHTATGPLEILRGLSTVEKAHLRELSTLFLHQKTIIGVKMPLTAEMRVTVAAQACLPILYLGLEVFSGWTDMLIYPTAFYVDRDEIDDCGVVHHQERLLSGEAWSRGPVIVSWDDIKRDIQHSHLGHNVIIHEIAHKLDMLDGSSNGMPPLHFKMPIPNWTAALSDAYAGLRQNLERHRQVYVDPYAVHSPAEFFAVFSEYFFCAPEVLHTHYPQVYEQLQLYYRQDPLKRCPPMAVMH